MEDTPLLPDYIPEDIKNIENQNERHYKILEFMLDYCNNPINYDELLPKHIKILYNYIITYDIVSFFNDYEFAKIVFNKLKEYENKDIPGPYNPKEWIPIAVEKLLPSIVACLRNAREDEIKDTEEENYSVEDNEEVKH